MTSASNALSAKRLFRESAPIAIVLAVWSLPSLLVWDGTNVALLVGGLLMATLFAIVRGSHLATVCSPVFEGSTPIDLLRENVTILAAAGSWFVAAQTIQILLPFLALSYFEIFDVLLFVLNGAGAGTVLVYVVAVGRQNLATDDRDEATEAESTPSGSPSVES